MNFLLNNKLTTIDVIFHAVKILPKILATLLHIPPKKSNQFYENSFISAHTPVSYVHQPIFSNATQKKNITLCFLENIYD